MRIDIPRTTDGPSMMVDGVESVASLKIETSANAGSTVWLNDFEVKAKVYRDGVLIVDTTASLLKAVVDRP